jgi:hypothetical protein
MAGAETGAAEVVVDVPEVDLTDGAGGPVYVVQVAGVGSECVMWTDVCRVVVPPRSKLKKIVGGAKAHLGELPATVRVLDVDAAKEHAVGLKERDPELVIA